MWQATRVWLPATPAASGRRVSEVEPALAAVPPGTRLPSVLYVHGCRGFEDDLTQWASALSAAGYAVFAPDSSARGERPPACAAATLYARTDIPRFTGREAEVRYTLQQMRTLAWLVRESVFLLGFDQGGVVAAGWREREFAGIIITGWSCTSPDVREGLFTPPDRPVLAIRWAEDPLFRDPAWNGDCEVHLPPRPGSRSLVLDGRGHSTAASPAAREAVLRFLNAHAVR
ncbi:MAG TPA: dienelactone hydrolase family protein [Candidatus Binatia bacterium]|nr:dienelactone hydrolase family protein [Candidatus Binatia bacterium]